MSFLHKLRDVLLHPHTFWAKITHERTIVPAFLYYLILNVVFLVIYSANGYRALQTANPAMVAEFTANMAARGLGPLPAVIFSGVLLVALFVIGSFVNSGVLHLVMRLLKGRGRFVDTYKAYVYGATPQLLLMAIPYIGLVSPLWMLYLQFVGTAALHKLPIWKVILGFILAVCILFAILYAPLFVVSIFGGPIVP